MFTDKLRFLSLAFALILIVTSVAAADEINQGDIPEICVVCDGVALQYGVVDTCWPGDTISVPVYYTSADTLTYLQIWGTLPAGLTYDSSNTAGTPWTGSIIDTSSGSTIEIHLGRGGTLPPDTLARVLDIVLDISDSFSFDTSFTINFGHNVAAQIIGDLFDCDVTDTTSGMVTIPNDTVIVTFDSTVAYSYQASDTSDQAKMDNPAKVPVKLFTNFPCSTYVIWFDVPDSLEYVGYDTLITGVQVTRYGTTDSLKIHGTMPSKPGNDSTYYLCDLKFEVGNFKYRYDASQTFDTTLYLGFPISGVIPPLTHVSNWGTNDIVVQDSISKVSEGIYLPQYKVFLDIKSVEVDEYGQVEVPVTCSTTFWAQYNYLHIGYDTTYLSFSGIDSTGGMIPPIQFYAIVDTIGDLEVRRFETTYSDSGLYILPDLEQTLFTIKFDTKDAFLGDDKSDISFVNSVTTNKIFDFFSPSNETYKIVRDQNDNLVWSTSNGSVYNPFWFSVSLGGPTYYSGYRVRLEIDVEYVNLDSVFLCEFAYAYPDMPVADSVTEGDWGFFEEGVDWGQEGGAVYLHLPFEEEIDTSGVLAYIWVTDEGEGNFEIGAEESWVEYWLKEEWDTLGVTVVGNSIPYVGQSKPSTGLPGTFTLSQNYPNPFNAQTNIAFNMPIAGFAELVVYDILGRQIKTLVSDELPAGKHIVNWDGANAAGKPIAGGVYFYVLNAGDFRESKKMLYLK